MTAKNFSVSWTPHAGATQSVQWLVNSAPVGGAINVNVGSSINQTLNVNNGDTVQATVTLTDSNGSSASTSAPLAAFVAEPPPPANPVVTQLD